MQKTFLYHQHPFFLLIGVHVVVVQGQAIAQIPSPAPRESFSKGLFKVTLALAVVI